MGGVVEHYDCEHPLAALELNGGDPPCPGVPVRCTMCGKLFGEFELEALGVDIIFWRR